MSEHDEYLFEKRQTHPGPKVQVETPPNIGWSVFGNLVSHDTQAEPDVTDVIQLQVQFDNQMQTHTVQFNGPDNVAVGSIGAVICEAEILWSVEGVTVRRVVTVTDGMAVSGEAQSVTVNIYDRSWDPLITYNVGCTVAPGLRGNTQQPPLYHTVGEVSGPGVGTRFPFGAAVPAGGAVFWLIPANIGAVSSYMAVAGAAPPALPLAENGVAITHYNGGFVPIQDYGLGGCHKYVPLFGSTRMIEIVNQSPNTIVVSHHIGIEG